MPPGQFQNRPHLDAAAEQMGDENHLCGRRNRLPPLLRGRRHPLRIEIDRHRHQPVVLDDADHVGNRDRRDEHLRAAKQIERGQEEIESAPHGETRQRIAGRRPERLHPPRNGGSVRRNEDAASPKQEIRPTDIQSLS